MDNIGAAFCLLVIFVWCGVVVGDPDILDTLRDRLAKDCHYATINPPE